ncbi:MAG TPA: hypothetical protein VFV02_14610, partial [Acidimicrobiales bacterium]|nr:hypothetical protein [Acidimicrobiales bacterium]
MVSHPAWSADGMWVAFLRSPTSPSGTGFPDSAALWVARFNGSDAHQVSSVGHQVEEFAWAALSDTLGFSDTSDPANGHWQLLTATPQSSPRTLLNEMYPFDLAWSPTGDSLAVTAISGAIGPSGQWNGMLQVLPAHGGSAHTVYTSPDNAIDLAGWSPNGKYLAFWIDPQSS